MSHLPMAIPRGSWVLVTGANCYTGSHVVIELLKQGFKVRGTVRDLSYSKWLLEHPSVKPHTDEGKVELVVANTSKPGDFDEAVKGVSAIIHLANIGDYTPDPNAGFASAIEASAHHMSTQSINHPNQINQIVEFFLSIKSNHTLLKLK
ncbi:hypothetical protein V3481_006270 [Fusarium oxysporum f. sp. vasinfectum]